MVDPRLLQANERTLLAWIRTSIALMTFGFVIARIGVWLRMLSPADHPGHELGSAWIGSVFVALGAVANAIAVIRYASARRAIKEGREIPDAWFPALLGVLVTIFGAAIGAYLLQHLI